MAKDINQKADAVKKHANPAVEDPIETAANLLPMLGSVAAGVLPVAGIALAAVSPEAALLLPIIGKIAPIAFNALSQLIKEGLDVYDKTEEQVAQDQAANDQDQTNKTDAEKTAKEISTILAEIGIIAGPALKALGDTAAIALAGVGQAISAEDPALGQTLQASGPISNQVLKAMGDGASGILPAIGAEIQDAVKGFEALAQAFNQQGNSAAAATTGTDQKNPKA